MKNFVGSRRLTHSLNPTASESIRYRLPDDLSDDEMTPRTKKELDEIKSYQTLSPRFYDKPPLFKRGVPPPRHSSYPSQTDIPPARPSRYPFSMNIFTPPITPRERFTMHDDDSVIQKTPSLSRSNSSLSWGGNSSWGDTASNPGTGSTGSFTNWSSRSSIGQGIRDGQEWSRVWSPRVGGYVWEDGLGTRAPEVDQRRRAKRKCKTRTCKAKQKSKTRTRKAKQKSRTRTRKSKKKSKTRTRKARRKK